MSTAYILGDTIYPEETSTQATTNDSDVNSNITAEIEDASERRDWIAKRILNGFWDSRHTSYFVQRILQEDSSAGVAVVNLFVALKRAKEEVDVLSRLNNEVVGKIRDLSLEAGVAKREYKVLTRHMHSFIEKIEADAKALFPKSEQTKEDSQDNLPKPIEESPQKAASEVCVQGDSPRWTDNTQNLDLCCSCNRRFWIQRDQLRRLDCMGDFIAPSPSRMSISLKGIARAIVIGAKENQFHTDVLPMKVFMTGYCDEELDMKRSEDDVKEPSAKMICDATRVEDQAEDGAEAVVPELTDEPGKSCETALNTSQNPVHIFSDDSSASLTTDAKASESRELFCWNCGTKGLKEGTPTCQSCGKDIWSNPFSSSRQETDEEPLSEGESVFEEALSEPFYFKTRTSVTCMGDLTKTAKEKKSASTLTVNSDVTSSWIGKLTEDIKSKILNLKPFRKKETVEERTINEAMTHSGALEFKITANTPVGVFDVIVKQYKDGKEVSGFSVGLQDTSTVSQMFDKTDSKPQPAGVAIFKGEDLYWSDISLMQSECEPVEASYNSGEDDMEEFKPIEDAKQIKKAKPQPKPEKRRLAQAALKTDKAPFFEIQKCHPKHFVQEIVPKTLQNLPKTKEDILTLLEGGKVAEGVEHKLVIEDSSNDLLIYIQVEVDGAERANQVAEAAVLSDISLREEMLRKKTVTFVDESSKQVIKKEIKQMQPEKEARKWSQAVVVDILDNVQTANVLLPQKQIQDIIRIEMKEVEEPNPVTPSPSPPEEEAKPDIELEKALALIRDIENDVMEVKLSDAVLILPILESELRKHLQHKMKTFADRETHSTASLDNFVSAAEFGSVNELPDDKSDDSEGRLRNLLTLLADLEEAVKTNEIFKDPMELCDRNSSRIYQLLHALANSIRELEEDATVVSLAETLDIASELDTAVREYDSIVKKEPLEYVTPEVEKNEREVVEESDVEKEEMSVMEHLTNVRKRVFEIVVQEAVATEGRIERDFDRINRLERQNKEAMKFVESFLRKTERRRAELNNIKTGLRDLSGVLNEFYLELVKIRSERNSTQPRRPTVREKDESPPAKEVPVRDTISGLLLAIKDLKSRAREKKEVCRGILERVSGDYSNEKYRTKSYSRSSRSSYTAKHSDEALSLVKEFKQIGQNSLYLSWTKPEGALAEAIVGYEILVNGKLNQKVRNPQRLQAVLYSVNLSQEAEIQLFALVENEPRILLSTVTYVSI